MLSIIKSYKHNQYITENHFLESITNFIHSAAKLSLHWESCPALRTAYHYCTHWDTRVNSSVVLTEIGCGGWEEVLLSGPGSSRPAVSMTQTRVRQKLAENRAETAENRAETAENRRKLAINDQKFGWYFTLWRATRLPGMSPHSPTVNSPG